MVEQCISKDAINTINRQEQEKECIENERNQNQDKYNEHQQNTASSIASLADQQKSMKMLSLKKQNSFYEGPKENHQRNNQKQTILSKRKQNELQIVVPNCDQQSHLKSDEISSLSPAKRKLINQISSKELDEKQRQTLTMELMLTILQQASKRKKSKAEILLLDKSMHGVKFYYNLDMHTRLEMCQAMQIESISENKDVFRKGEYGDKFYIILQGEVGVWVPVPHIVQKIENEEIVTVTEMEMREVKSLSMGESFGEQALIYSKPRMATIRCKADCHFAILDKNQFDRILKEKEITKQIKEVQFLNDLELFEHWTFNLLNKVQLMSFTRQFSFGQMIYAEGDAVDDVYFVNCGEFLITKQIIFSVPIEQQQQLQYSQNQYVNDTISKHKVFKHGLKSRSMKIVILSKGGIFGEEEIMLSQNVRGYTVKCVSDKGECVTLSKSEFIRSVLPDSKSESYLKELVRQKQKLQKEKIGSFKQVLTKYSLPQEFSQKQEYQNARLELAKSLQQKFNPESLLQLKQVMDVNQHALRAQLQIYSENMKNVQAINDTIIAHNNSKQGFQTEQDIIDDTVYKLITHNRHPLNAYLERVLPSTTAPKQVEGHNIDAKLIGQANRSIACTSISALNSLFHPKTANTQKKNQDLALQNCKVRNRNNITQIKSKNQYFLAKVKERRRFGLETEPSEPAPQMSTNQYLLMQKELQTQSNTAQQFEQQKEVKNKHISAYEISMLYPIVRSYQNSNSSETKTLNNHPNKLRLQKTRNNQLSITDQSIQNTQQSYSKIKCKTQLTSEQSQMRNVSAQEKSENLMKKQLSKKSQIIKKMLNSCFHSLGSNDGNKKTQQKSFKNSFDKLNAILLERVSHQLDLQPQQYQKQSVKLKQMANKSQNLRQSQIKLNRKFIIL